MIGVAGLLITGLLQGAVAPEQAAEPATQTVQVVEESEIDRQVREIASELRCPVCQGLSLQDSPSELSQEMRDVIRSRLEAGDSPEQVKEYFVGRYGEWILLEPEARGFNLAVYLLPVAAIVLGGFVLIVVGRRWLAGSGGVAADTHIAEDDPDLASWEDTVAR